MAASTNAGSGYSITVNGPTLTSGSNTILPMNVAATSTHGVSQFGLNLRANTTTTPGFPFGTDVAPVSNTTNYRAKPLAGYDTAETFKYIDGDPVADSSDGGTLGATDAQIYTVSYIANVPGSQPAGTYSTTFYLYLYSDLLVHHVAASPYRALVDLRGIASYPHAVSVDHLFTLMIQ